ncbi:hypothetical protein IJJ12_02685, partial [bacterium]|nr:hypothetical protein [bacterium]
GAEAAETAPAAAPEDPELAMLRKQLAEANEAKAAAEKRAAEAEAKAKAAADAEVTRKEAEAKAKAEAEARAKKDAEAAALKAQIEAAKAAEAEAAKREAEAKAAAEAKAKAEAESAKREAKVAEAPKAEYVGITPAPVPVTEVTDEELAARVAAGDPAEDGEHLSSAQLYRRNDEVGTDREVRVPEANQAPELSESDDIALGEQLTEAREIPIHTEKVTVRIEGADKSGKLVQTHLGTAPLVPAGDKNYLANCGQRVVSIVNHNGHGDGSPVNYFGVGRTPKRIASGYVCYNMNSIPARNRVGTRLYVYLNFCVSFRKGGYLCNVTGAGNVREFSDSGNIAFEAMDEQDWYEREMLYASSINAENGGDPSYFFFYEAKEGEVVNAAKLLNEARKHPEQFRSFSEGLYPTLKEALERPKPSQKRAAVKTTATRKTTSKKRR